MNDHVTAEERLQRLRDREVKALMSVRAVLEIAIVVLLIVVVLLVFGLIDMRDQRDRALYRAMGAEQDRARLRSQIELIVPEPRDPVCWEMGFGLGVFCVEHPVLIAKERAS